MHCNDAPSLQRPELRTRVRNVPEALPQGLKLKKRGVTIIVLTIAGITAATEAIVRPHAVNRWSENRPAVEGTIPSPDMTSAGNTTIEEFTYTRQQTTLISKIIAGEGSQADYRRMQLIYLQRFAGNPQSPYRVFWTWKGSLGSMVWSWGPDGGSMSARISSLDAILATDRTSAATAAAWAMWPVLEGSFELRHLLDESLASHRYASRRINGFTVTVTPGEPLDITIFAGEPL